MKIAIPVKTNKDNPAVSPLFGKAKWFAFVEDGNITIKKNLCHGGGEVIRWFLEENVDTIIFQEMGTTPYNLIKQTNKITLFHSGYERILLDDLLDKFTNNTLELIDDTNIDKIIQKHESKHTHDHEHHH